MSPRKADEPVRLTRIYTRGGDGGQTSLGDGSRASKLDPLVRAYGAVDELNSTLGWAQVVVKSPILARIQNELFDVGADLSVPYAGADDRLRTTQEAVDRLEREKPPSWPELEAFTRQAVERFHRPEEGISICPAPSGPQRCTDEMLAGCAGLAEELDLAIHIHVLETRMQAVSGQRMYGATLVEHMAEIGFLSPRVSFEHGIWLTDGDIELVRDHGVTIVHNPVSNMKLGSGICPVPQLLKNGVNVALGTDGMCSNDGNDFYAAMKTAALLHKLWEVDYEEWLGATEAWAMATAGGAAAAGDRDGLGRIEAGRRADLVLLDLDSLQFTPLNNALHQLVLGSTTLAVDSAIVGGKVVLRNGTLTGIDERAILAEAREVGAEIIGRHDEAFSVGQELLASVRAGWLDAMATDVGVERKLAR